ncbi:MAG: ribosome silencing factor [Myxococcaceae bacterium]|nr:ribosome silencing factor [Myxococcaceae bacterium]
MPLPKKKKFYRQTPKPKVAPKAHAAKKPSKVKVKAQARLAPKKGLPKPKRAKPSRVPSSRPVKDNPAAHQLAHDIAGAILDKKATDVVLLDVRGKASYADYLVIGSGDTERHVTALAEAVHEKLKPKGHHPFSTEGETTGHWVLLDYGDVVAHLFNSDVRSFYDLEGLWADAPSERVDA